MTMAEGVAHSPHDPVSPWSPHPRLKKKKTLYLKTLIFCFCTYPFVLPLLPPAPGHSDDAPSPSTAPAEEEEIRPICPGKVPKRDFLPLPRRPEGTRQRALTNSGWFALLESQKDQIKIKFGGAKDRATACCASFQGSPIYCDLFKWLFFQLQQYFRRLANRRNNVGL